MHWTFVAQNLAQLAAREETLEGDLELLKEAHKTDMDAAAAELASVQEASISPPYLCFSTLSPLSTWQLGAWLCEHMCSQV
jgi:hypothetical protein